MTATFLIALDVDDTDLLLIAEELKQQLIDNGESVLSVKPWARPTLSPPGGLVPPVPPGKPGIQ